MTNEFVPLSQIVPREREFLWDGLIPVGALTLLDGDPGDGKSTLVCDLASRVSTGSPMPLAMEKRPPADVLLLQAEDDPAATVRPRLEGADADLDRIHVLNPDTAAGTLDLANDLSMVEQAITANNVKLVVVDPLTSFLGGMTLQYRRIRQVLAPLAEVGRQTGTAVVLVRHLVKSDRSKALYRGLGGVDVIGIARSALLVVRDPESESEHGRLLLPTKSNLVVGNGVRFQTRLGPNGATTVEWLGVTKTTADDVLARPSDKVGQSALEEAKDVLFDILSDGPLPAKEVQRRAGEALVSTRTLRRAKVELGVRSVKRGRGPGSSWHWQLSDDPALFDRQKEKAIDYLADQLFHGEHDPNRERKTSTASRSGLATAK